MTSSLASTETQERLKRIQQSPGVQGIIITNHENIPIWTTMDNATTVHYANLLSSVASKARDCVRDLDPMNDLTFARIRTRKNEIILAPDRDYMLTVIQSPTNQ